MPTVVSDCGRISTPRYQHDPSGQPVRLSGPKLHEPSLIQATIHAPSLLFFVVLIANVLIVIAGVAIVVTRVLAMVLPSGQSERIHFVCVRFCDYTRGASLPGVRTHPYVLLVSDHHSPPRMALTPATFSPLLKATVALGAWTLQAGFSAVSTIILNTFHKLLDGCSMTAFQNPM